MPDTINLPAIGQTKRTYVYAGAALVVGVVGYAWFKSRGAAPPPADAGVSDVPVDELPGQSGGPPFASTGGGTSDTGAVFITTNAQWTTAALAAMIDLGYDSVQVSSALGKVLANQEVTSTEANWYYTAIGLVGEPPIGQHAPRIKAAGSTPTTPAATHKYVVQLHEFSVDTAVRDAVRRFSAGAPVSNVNSIQVAVTRTSADPRNLGDTYVKGGIGYFRRQRKTYVTTVQAA